MDDLLFSNNYNTSQTPPQLKTVPLLLPQPVRSLAQVPDHHFPRDGFLIPSVECAPGLEIQMSVLNGSVRKCCSANPYPRFPATAVRGQASTSEGIRGGPTSATDLYNK